MFLADQSYIRVADHLISFPGLAIYTVVLAADLLGG
jgi:ABC-type dipeptide/oligopeptide/nickel transport system permease subunit